MYKLASDNSAELDSAELDSAELDSAELGLIRVAAGCFLHIYCLAGELHLTPVCAAVQLRPSFQYLDKGDAAKLGKGDKRKFPCTQTVWLCLLNFLFVKGEHPPKN